MRELECSLVEGCPRGQWEEALISWHYGPVLNMDEEGSMLAAGHEADLYRNSQAKGNIHGGLTASALPSSMGRECTSAPLTLSLNM